MTRDTSASARRRSAEASRSECEPDRGRWWRTLDERAEDPAFQEFLHNEFPSAIEAVSDPVARRTFMKLMGASIALAGASACTRQPAERIVPYVRQPENVIPGKPLFYATAMPLGGAATGLLVESHEGRPTKIEGNPLHPGSLGASDVFAQAAVLGLYDPERSQTLTNLGEIRPWSAFLGALRGALTAQQPLEGAGIRILTEAVSSPTLAAQIRDLLARFPKASWHQWDPASRDHAREGARLAFGEPVDARYHFDRADVVVSIDADFLGGGAGWLRYTRDFVGRRRLDQPDRMNRLYAIDSTPTGTGARADHRLPLRPSQIETFTRHLAQGVGVPGVVNPPPLPDPAAAWIAAVVKDLRAHRGSSLVVAGDDQPASVHALAHAINESLDNVGRTVVYIEPIDASPGGEMRSLQALVADMNAGKVDLMLIVGGNPVYTTPFDLGFAAALGKVQLRAHLSLYEDETSEQCQWQIPETHFLESWSDARAYDGTASIIQPLIAPLYGGKSAHEFLAAMTDRPERSGYEIVREYWAGRAGGAGRGAFEANWRRWLHDGVIPNSASPLKSVRVRTAALASAAAAQSSGLEILFRNDPSVLDGRFANNGWLQELPKPITRLTWDNAALISPATAARLGVGGAPATMGGEHGQIASDVVELRVHGRSVQAPIFIVAGQADDCVTVHLGYGRARGGRLASAVGFNANAVRSASAPDFDNGVEIVKTGETQPLACTQYHHLMEGRGTVHAGTRDAFAHDPKSIHGETHEGGESPRMLTLYPAYEYTGYKWGMAIDVNACVGCNACVVGCQAENNIPIVGKEQVLRGREMHWLRVDTYYRGEVARPETYFQPVPCMQCENAPCEVVCPVGATVHSAEGLNDMVYNRCVGTRYCSNNCPYKVRRFNFLLYQDWNTPSLKLGRNPDVSVRSRGVMEKCTYCVQRINAAKIESEKEDRSVRDGEIQTACQQACPADAIVFGNLNDPASRVSRLQAEARNYSLLEDLNTRPRTTYLGAVRNVNPELGS